MAEEKTDEVLPSPEIHFEPLVKDLPTIEVKSHDENEEVLFKMRAKLFRYDSSGEEAEWKERGTGEMKILKNKTTGHIRLLMRRDKTFKICANHLITSEMELKPNCGSDRAWVYSTPADLSENEPRPETLAIRFANSDNANKFKDKVEECQKLLETATNDESEKLAKELEGLNVKENENCKSEDTKTENAEKKETIESSESTDKESETPAAEVEPKAEPENENTVKDK